MSDGGKTFSDALAARLAGYRGAPCIEFEGRWYSGDDITAYIDAINETLRDAGVAEGAAVGVVARNRPPHAAAVVGLLAAGRWVSMIYSFQSPEAIARDVEQLAPAAVVADREDWTEPVVAAARRAGTAGIALHLQPPAVELVARPGTVGPRRRR